MKHAGSDVIRQVAALVCLWISGTASSMASEFSKPWLKPDHALVIDAYEYNQLDWNKLATDKKIVGFINKASDGLSPPYACPGPEVEAKLCKALWKRHAVARELFHTRRTLAKSFGLKWGAYHLARPGNPIDQANNFVDFAEPAPDDLMAIDIEDNDPEKWMSLDDAEEFVRHVQRRTGRFPILYTNGSTAKHIADNRDRYRLLSRLPLWYARYSSEIGLHFPMGYWQGYALWQFSSHANCGARHCPYRVPGTPRDIDVNVAAVNAEQLRGQWPYGGLLDVTPDLLATIPVPLTRDEAMAGRAPLAYAPVEPASAVVALANAFEVAGNRYPMRNAISSRPGNSLSDAYRQAASHAEHTITFIRGWASVALARIASPTVDPISTGAVSRKGNR